MRKSFCAKFLRLCNLCKSPQGETTEKTGPEGGVSLPLIAEIIVIIIAISAFVAYRKEISK
ncbi:hypothetical protein AKJ65_02135 [candidate division MSBL1 archaeon SCGC-AAA259E19]|uniref:Uncharacterized protein n=1 Tax=candidate division MSBL1 archaeon SCGC-AAA259E19 TaxID=1698264 RepID=A0A133UM02_9EURY|nr:hypothetical protein AKJ65_02135 [candidate division MSBL1 archaeon SCGC-AAA259E19]